MIHGVVIVCRSVNVILLFMPTHLHATSLLTQIQLKVLFKKGVKRWFKGWYGAFNAPSVAFVHRSR